MGKSRQRKNFLLSFSIAVVLWVFWLILFFFVPPEIPGITLAFLALTFAVFFLTAALLLASTRRGLIAAVGGVLVMLLSYYGAGDYLNILLVVGVLATVEYYLSKR